MTQTSVPPVESGYLVLSTDVRRALAENGVSLGDILTRSNLDQVEAREVPNPERPPEGAREVATIILASAAAVAVLTPLITRIVQAYTGRSVVVEDTELVAVLDGTGTAVRRADGQPVLAWRRKSHLLEPSARPVHQDVSVKGIGFEISLKQDQTG